MALMWLARPKASLAVRLALASRRMIARTDSSRGGRSGPDEAGEG